MIVVYQLLREYCPCIHTQGCSFVVIATRLLTSTKCAIVVYAFVQDNFFNKGRVQNKKELVENSTKGGEGVSDGRFSTKKKNP